MRKFLAALIAASILFIASSQFSHAAGVSIAVVDIQKLETESDAGLAAKEIFSKEVETRTKSISAKEEAFKLLESDYMKTRESLTPQQRAEREDKLSKENRELKRMSDDAKEELQKKGTELRSKNLNRIIAVIKRAAEDGKYTVVIDKRQALYTVDTIDITQKVMDMLNASTKGAGN